MSQDYQQRYYEQHREEKKRKRRERYAANRETERASRRQYYAEHRDEIRAACRLRLARRRLYNKKRRRDFKLRAVALLGGKCYDCGAEFPDWPEAFDFDHRDPAKKRGEPSQLLSAAWETLAAEIKKCDLVCSNCHRIRTARRNRGSTA